MKQFKRTILRSILDILYTVFLPLLPAILIYGIQKLAFNQEIWWTAIVVYALFVIVTFLFTFYKNSTHFEIDEREVRHYHFGKLIHTFKLEEYDFHYESRITSAGTVSLKLYAQKIGEKKRTGINCLGLGDKQVKEMIALIENDQNKLRENHEELISSETELPAKTTEEKEVTISDNE